MSRSVPEETALRQRYNRLSAQECKQRGKKAAQRLQECKALAATPDILVAEFLDATRKLRVFDNRSEGFYPGDANRTSNPVRGGTVVVTKSLAAHLNLVPAVPGYAFRFRHREVAPLRATRAPAGLGKRGGIDYVALREDTTGVPILGEIKFKSDQDPYYALVQLLTYLSEMSSEGQLVRANEHLFGGGLGPSPRYDLHILLADYNDRGSYRAVVQATGELVAAFQEKLRQYPTGDHALGNVLCLKMATRGYRGSLELVWRG